MNLRGKMYMIARLLILTGGVFILSSFLSFQTFYRSVNSRDSLIIKTLHYKSKKPNSTFSIDYPVLKGVLADSLEKVRNAEFLKQALEVKEGLINATKDLYNDPDGDCRTSSEDFSHSINPSLLTKKCLSYTIEKNGILFCTQHSFHSVGFVTIDLYTGMSLVLKNIFAGIDSTIWADTLASKARSGYLAQGLGFTPENSILFDPGAYFNYESFVLHDSEIVFYIDPIYIKEGVEGQLDFWMTIPYTELKSIIRQESPLWELIN